MTGEISAVTQADPSNTSAPQTQRPPLPIQDRPAGSGPGLTTATLVPPAMPTPAAPAGPAPTSDMRTFLQREFLRRCRANPRYSLRAFARMLAVDPSSLCKILNGKRSITLVMFDHLATKLGLGPNEMEALRPRPASSTAIDYHSFQYDLFEIISDWFHFAILELIQIEGFEQDPRWISQRLGINPQEARAAVERLQRTGFIKVAPNGTWTLDSNTTVGNNFTTAALRKLQRQVLEMGISALDEIPLERRDQSTITMAVDSSLLPQAKEKIKQFRRELDAFLSSSRHCDEVYHLSVSLYPVTRQPGSVT